MPVRIEKNDVRATVVIDDPGRRNPLSVGVMDELCDATAAVLADDEVRVIVYTGAGDRAFSAGGDLANSFADDPVGLHRERGRLADLFRMMTAGGKPTVARVNGDALAGGFGLAVACDITICVEGARLGTPEAGVGLWPMMISAVLMRAMPRKAVLEMMLTGRLITPEEAKSLGAVSLVVPGDALDSEVDRVVAALASRSAVVTRLGRDAFYSTGDADFDTALDRLQAGLTAVMATEDAEEGVTAFLEKRDPEWKGR